MASFRKTRSTEKTRQASWGCLARYWMVFTVVWVRNNGRLDTSVE